MTARNGWRAWAGAVLVVVLAATAVTVALGRFRSGGPVADTRSVLEEVRRILEESPHLQQADRSYAIGLLEAYHGEACRAARSQEGVLTGDAYQRELFGLMIAKANQDGAKRIQESLTHIRSETRLIIEVAD